MNIETEQTEVLFTSKCFESCIEDFKHKLMTPVEKECFKVCLKNLRGLYIEHQNGYTKAMQEEKFKEN